MKLLQLNCWGGKLGTQIIRLIEEESPDIVCLQEATDLTARPGSVLDPYTKFLPKEKYPYVAFGPTFSYRYMHELANLGNIIISKKALHNHSVHFVKNSFKTDIDSAETDEYNNRNFVHAEIKYGDKCLHILTHHGHHNPNGKDGSIENTKTTSKNC